MAQTNILLEAGTNELEIVEFYINEPGRDGDAETYRTYYGINVAKVLEIVRLPELTPLPDAMHPAVLGAFDLRQRIIPLLDLAVWLGKTPAPSHDQRVIVCEFNKVVSAFLVSGVSRIHRVSWADLEQPSDGTMDMTSEAITGVVRVEDRLVLVLDMEKILAEISADETALICTSRMKSVCVKQGQYRAVIADDSASIRRLIQGILERAGFEVQAFQNGREAYDRLLEIKEQAVEEGRPVTDYLDLVVSDIEMPGMDGHSLTRSIKEDRSLRVLPVILFSSLITDSLRHKGESVGADAQIAKPDITLLADHALEILHQRGQKPLP